MPDKEWSYGPGTRDRLFGEVDKIVSGKNLVEWTETWICSNPLKGLWMVKVEEKRRWDPYTKS